MCHTSPWYIIYIHICVHNALLLVTQSMILALLMILEKQYYNYKQKFYKFEKIEKVHVFLTTCFWYSLILTCTLSFLWGCYISEDVAINYVDRNFKQFRIQYVTDRSYNSKSINGWISVKVGLMVEQHLGLPPPPNNFLETQKSIAKICWFLFV